MSKIYYDDTKLTEKSVLADDDYFLVNDSETSNDETKFIYKKDLANQMGGGNFVKIAGDTMTGTLVGEIASGAGTATPSFKSTSKDNATDYFQIGNATGASGKFIPNFGGKSDTTGITSPAGAGEVPASYWSVQTNDNVVTPALVFDARDYTNTGSLATRHLFGVSSYNVMKWTTLPDGRLRYAQANIFDNDNDLVNKKYASATPSTLNNLSATDTTIQKIADKFDLGQFKMTTYQTEYDNGNSGVAKTIDWNNGQNQKITLTANCVLTLPSVTGTGRFQLKVIQDGTGARSLSFSSASVKNPTNFDFASGTANQECIITFYWDGAKYIFLSTPYYS